MSVRRRNDPLKKDQTWWQRTRRGTGLNRWYKKVFTCGKTPIKQKDKKMCDHLDNYDSALDAFRGRINHERERVHAADVWTRTFRKRKYPLEKAGKINTSAAESLDAFDAFL